MFLNQNSKILSTLLLLLSISFFVLGLAYPIITTKQQILGITLNYEKVWLFTSIKFFFRENEYFLGIIILVFTFIFPVIKYLDIINRTYNIVYVNSKISSILAITDKWSMLDVFIVALILLNFKMDSNIIVMKIRIGTTFLALSILMRLILSIINSKNK